MKKRIVLAGALAVLAVFAGTGLIGKTIFAQQKAAEKPKETCMTGQCHANMGKEKYVHGPIAAGECVTCHGEAPKHKEDPKNNKFKPIKNVAEKCFACHEKFKVKKFSHVPAEDGDCLACHSPHGSEYKFQMKAKGAEVCFECHDAAIVENKFVHGPAAVGGCVACHEPHTADYAKNLKAEGPELCYTCHTEKAEVIHKAQFVHKPVSEKCTSCHNPHAAPKQFMLESESPTLCLGCHKDKKEQMDAVTYKHGALVTDKSCLNCHDAHNSNIAKNLTQEPMDLCLSCHNREYKRPDGKPVSDIKKWLAENTDYHGPIRQKDCSGCHNPHGSNNFRILRYFYPPTFYEAFAVENYNLCFSCHEKTLVLNQETTKLTNFRNGNVNLHFLHVNKAIKGRTCRACHETHASNFPKHIREAVPFGGWDLPVNFEKTNTGGSCTPGCHKIKKYDREKKEANL